MIIRVEKFIVSIRHFKYKFKNERYLRHSSIKPRLSSLLQKLVELKKLSNFNFWKDKDEIQDKIQSVINVLTTTIQQNPPPLGLYVETDYQRYPLVECLHDLLQYCTQKKFELSRGEFESAECIFELYGKLFERSDVEESEGSKELSELSEEIKDSINLETITENPVFVNGITFGISSILEYVTFNPDQNKILKDPNTNLPYHPIVLKNLCETLLKQLKKVDLPIKRETEDGIDKHLSQSERDEKQKILERVLKAQVVCLKSLRKADRRAQLKLKDTYPSFEKMENSEPQFQTYRHNRFSRSMSRRQSRSLRYFDCFETTPRRRDRYSTQDYRQAYNQSSAPGTPDKKFLSYKT